MEQFGPALQWPWSKLTDVPELTDELLDRLVVQSDEQAAGRSIRELEALRDDCLVAVIRGLAGVRFGAGEVVAEHEARLRGQVPRTVSLVFGDGHRSEVHPFWLRDNCECGECVHPQTRERLLDTFALDPDVAPTSIDADDHEMRVVWSDGHRSTYALAHLRRFCPCSTCVAPDDPPRRHWGAEMAGRLPEVEYGAVMTTDEALLRFVEAVWIDGVAFVRDAPTNEDALRALARRVAHIRETNFGPDFHVEAMVDPNNVAYTSVELRPHVDLVNHEHPPGMQFLHCLVADAPGGESTLVDGFWIADRLKAEAPDDFRLLCDVPIPYRFHDVDNDLRFTAPVIGLGPDGAYREIRFHNALMAPLTVPLAMVEPTYAALRRFDAIARSDAAQVVVRLRPGDVMVFHNRRVLHGRRAFDPGGGYRHLFGLYVDAPEWRSRMRVLRRGG
jgi:gamma-butyrobetaine dioxygenase